MVSVLYRSQRVLITEDVFETVRERRIRFAIRELSEIRIVRRRPEGLIADRVLGFSALGAALVAIPVVSPDSRLAAGMGVIVLLAAAAVSLWERRGGSTWELTANYRGCPVTLFASTNQTEFYQVCRGFRRALERPGDNG